MNRTLVGVDLGGTNIRAAVATGATTHGPITRRETPAGDGPETVLDAVSCCVRDAAGAEPVHGVAIGIPGPLDPGTGVVHAAPHLAGWSEVPARELLEARLGCPVSVRNDATIAGFAEWKAGAGRGTAQLVFISAGTGIGGALVLNGTLHDGIGSAGELGHMPIDPEGPRCGQGHLGCLEGTASGSAIAAAARRALDSGTASSLRALDRERLSAKDVEEAAKAGDALAIQLLAAAGRALGRSIGGLINLLAPEIVVIGGGLINGGDLLFEPMRAAVPEIAFAYPLSRCRIVPAALGTDAGLVGAIAWAVHTFG